VTTGSWLLRCGGKGKSEVFEVAQGCICSWQFRGTSGGWLRLGEGLTLPRGSFMCLEFVGVNGGRAGMPGLRVWGHTESGFSGLWKPSGKSGFLERGLSVPSCAAFAYTVWRTGPIGGRCGCFGRCLRLPGPAIHAVNTFRRCLELPEFQRYLIHGCFDINSCRKTARVSAAGSDRWNCWFGRFCS
jgi:hypothetical protein